MSQSKVRIQIRKWAASVAAIFAGVCLLAFQNCGSGFSALKLQESLTSSSLTLPPPTDPGSPVATPLPTQGACTLDTQTIADGASMTGYFATDVSMGESCKSETRVCKAGVLSGSAPSSWCVAHAAPRLSTLLAAGGDITVPAGQKYEVDTVGEIGLLDIQGQLVCPNGGNYTLKVKGISVEGAGSAFICGTQDARFPGHLDIQLMPGLAIAGSERTFMAMNGGMLKFSGQNANVNWYHLAETAEAGATAIRISGAARWNIGDHIAIAPTTFDPHEAEEAIVTAISDGGKIVLLDRGLKFRHWGGTQSFTTPQKTWILDESAEVINLTRNILIEAPGDGPSLDYMGGHVMIMSGGSAYIDSVEFTHLGQMGVMARYPFHWHRMGDVSGQYIVNSSLHDTFQRCITVHGTNNALVQNNVCYDHFGHGYFLEDGNEVGNKFIGNVGMLTKAPPRGRQILESDIDRATLPRWAGPATFWISNPSNVFTGNVAAGSEGTGFWNSFAEQVSCSSSSCQVVTNGTGNVFPSKTAYGTFDNNVAHSTLIGMTWDGSDIGPLTNNPRNPNDRQVQIVHYTPPTTPTVNGNVVTKNSMNGIYFRGQPFVFNQMIFADNNNGAWLAYNQTVQNSAIIANSANHTDADYDLIGKFGGNNAYQSGVWLYDGPLMLNKVDFINFSATQINRNGVNVSSVPFRTVGGANRYTNRVQGLTFTPEPWHRFILSADNWMDSPYTLNVRDLDGSLTGAVGGLLVVDTGFNAHSSCSKVAGTRAMACGYTPSSISFGTLYTPFSVQRNDGARSRNLVDLPPSMLFAKIGLIPNAGFEYTFRFGVDLASVKQTPFNYQSESIGTVSPVMLWANIGTGCKVKNALGVASLAQVRSASNAVYWASGNDLYLRLVTTGWDGIAPNLQANAGYQVSCSGHAAVDPLTDPKIFDPDLYRSFYADLATFTDDQLRAHWIATGLAEGRVANLIFVVDEYIAMYSDIPKSRIEAARHFIANGYGEGRISRFGLHADIYNQGQYQSYNSDLSLMSDDEARNHWIQSGISEGRRASAKFDVRTYLSRYPDLAAALGAQNYSEAIKHYVTSGISEGRSGTP